MTNSIKLVAIVTLGLLLVSVGCTPNIGAEPLSVESQLASGERIYRKTCATSNCHGTQGQGIRSGDDFKVWPLVGAEFQSRHPNAQVVFDVIRSGNEKNLLALTDQQVYDSIAYELAQNQIPLAAPLVADNAFATYGGAMSGEVDGGLYPPSDNIQGIETTPPLELPISANSEGLRIQVDQLAQAGAIGNNQGDFLILVIFFNVLGSQPVELNPEHLNLSTPDGELLKPASIKVRSAIENFHLQTIRPEHGTVGLVVFNLNAHDGFDGLIYDDGDAGNRVILRLRP